MQILSLVFLLFVALFVVSVVVAMIVAVISLAAIALMIGVPAYFLLRSFSKGRTLGNLKQSSLERLQQLYVEGKIDLFEFERRVARLIAVERY